MNTIIGIAGNATVGKDTFAELLKDKIPKLNPKTTVYHKQLGDYVKSDLNDLQKIPFDFKALQGDQKELARPLMLEYGILQRKLTNGDYFIKCFLDDIKNCVKNSVIIVTGIRYINELSWLQGERAALVYIDRILENKPGESLKLIPPANDEEKDNNRCLRKQADYYIMWETTNNLEVRIPYVDACYHGLRRIGFEM